MNKMSTEISLVANSGTLLGMTIIKSSKSNLKTVYDLGACHTFITFDKAKTLGLKGIDISLNVTNFGDFKWKGCSQLYEVELHTLSGEIKKVIAAGVSEITSPIDKMDVGKIVFIHYFKYFLHRK